MIKILTLNWNGAHNLQKLYESLLPCLDELEWVWLIKDNGSVDDSISLINSWNNKNISVLECGHNRDSFSKGCNILFNESNSTDDDIIILLNNDIVFGDNTSIKNMSSLLKGDVGVVGARILYPDTNTLQHAGVFFSRKFNYLPYHYKHKQKSDKEAETNRELQAVTGAVMLLRAREYRSICTTNASKLCGLDEKLFWSFEDIDACLAIKYNLNKKIMYCGNTLIYHEESATLNKNPVNKLMMPNNVKTFKDKWWGIYKLDD